MAEKQLWISETRILVKLQIMFFKLSMCVKRYQQRDSKRLLKLRERAVFPKCETSEGLCAKARDFKLTSLNEYNNYSEGTRCFAK